MLLVLRVFNHQRYDTSESTATLHVKQSTPIEHPQTLTKFHVGSLIGYFVQFGATLTSR